MRQGRRGKPIQIYLTDAERRALEELAGRLRRPLSAEIRHAIERHLAAPPSLDVPALPGEAGRDEPAG